MRLFIKKVWSWNPTKYKFVKLETAMCNYETYLTYFRMGWKPKDAPKTFKEWLRSEI